MITFKAVVPPRKKADGTYNVKIRVTFKRKSRWLPTNIWVTDADITRGRKIKNSGVMASTNALCDELRELAGRLSPFTVEAWDIDAVIRWLRTEKNKVNFRLDFFAYGEKVAATQTVSMGKRTRTALRAFSRFLNGGPCDVNDITVTLLQNFVRFVEDEPKQSGGHPTSVKKREGRTAKIHLSHLAAIHKAACLEFNDEDVDRICIPRNPFARVQVKAAPPVGQRNLGPDLIQRLILAETENKVQRRSLDAFVVSFALMGANIADLWNAPPPANGSLWVYERRKTSRRRNDRARIEVRIPDCIAPYLERLRDPSGRRWLALPGKTAGSCSQLLNRALRLWAEENGVEPFTMYAARHSWASIARSKAVGIDKATVDDCLNHVSMALADIYIEKDFEVFHAANARVLEIFTWPQ